MVQIVKRKKTGSFIRGRLSLIRIILVVSGVFLCLYLISLLIVNVHWEDLAKISTTGEKQVSFQEFQKNITRYHFIHDLSVDDGDIAIQYNYYPSRYGQTSPSVDCGIGPTYDKYFSLDSLNRSRFHEDRKLYERFFAKHMHDENFKGTYVELGAFDGVRESNTRFFDECLGWDGLLIEGNPYMYEKLVGNRPNSHRLSYAPSCVNTGETVEFYAASFTNAGLTDHVKVIKNNKKIKVPCGPLGPILEKMFPDGHVTFFSLDVEGAEKLVLDTIDFEKIRVDIFMIEVENGLCKGDQDCEVRNQVRELMKAAGYKRKLNVVQMSDVFVHPDSPYVDE
mmetsp:Transcript_15642/g.29500  ORF Transcript_15642/g.29500 Transcript_15642/m.29500 type:complete len:337 (+) Transcript_15642:51-1061(+)